MLIYGYNYTSLLTTAGGDSSCDDCCWSYVTYRTGQDKYKLVKLITIQCEDFLFCCIWKKFCATSIKLLALTTVAPLCGRYGVTAQSTDRNLQSASSLGSCSLCCSHCEPTVKSQLTSADTDPQGFASPLQGTANCPLWYVTFQLFSRLLQPGTWIKRNKRWAFSQLPIFGRMFILGINLGT